MLIRSFLCSFALLSAMTCSVYADKVDLYKAEQLEFRTENGAERAYTKEGSPFFGAVVLSDAGNNRTTYFYKNGKKNGVAVSHTADNKVVSETTYVDGKKNGVEKVYYPNGNPQYQRSYKDDVINGIEVLFWENGNPQKQSSYENGILHGEVHYFDEAGSHYKTENYKNGIKNGIERIVKDKSLLAENNYVDGRLHGVCKKFNEKYLTDETDYVEGTREGWQKHYNADGTIEEIPYHYDMKNGIANLYKKVKVQEQTDDGAAEKAKPKTVIVNKNIRTTTYADDKKNGFETTFNADNQPSAIKNYTADKTEGISRYFDDENKLKEVKFFKGGQLSGSVNLYQDEKISRIYEKYNEGKIGPLLKQRNIWYRILWLGISLNDANLVEDLRKAMKMYNFEINDMGVYRRFSGADFANQTDDLYFGLTPFMYALSVSAPKEILQKFINQKQEPDAEGETPLHYFVRLNNAQCAEKLLELWSDDDNNEETDEVLFYALENGVQAKIIEMLLNNTHRDAADINGRSLSDYALKAHASPDVITLLMKAGEGINKDANSALLTEMLRQNQPITYITSLLEENLDASGLDDTGHSALYYVGINNYPQKIKDALLKAGAVWSRADKQSMLDAAVSRDDVAAIEDVNIPLNEWDNITIENANALQYAYDSGASLKILQYLAEKGVDINHQDRNGITLLHKAIAKGDVETIIKLIEWGAAVNLPDKRGNTALSMVIDRADLAAARKAVLAKLSADDAMLKIPNSEIPLWFKLYKNSDIEVLSELFAKVEKPLQLGDKNGSTALDLLLEEPEDSKFREMANKYFNSDDFEVVRKVVQLHRPDLWKKIDTGKLDANATDKDGETLLTLAVKSGAEEDFIAMLLEKGADINLPNAESERALDIALKQNKMELAEYLIKHGADINADAFGGKLAMSLKHSDTALTDWLIKNEVDISYVSEDGETVLMAAVKNLNLPLVKYALEKGVDVNVKDASGNTVLLCLADAIKQYKADNSEEVRNNIISIIKILAEYGADMNVRDESGRSFLILASIEHPIYYDELQQVYVSAGGVVSLKDQYGKTAEEYLAQ